MTDDTPQREEERVTPEEERVTSHKASKSYFFWITLIFILIVLIVMGLGSMQFMAQQSKLHNITKSITALETKLSEDETRITEKPAENQPQEKPSSLQQAQLLQAQFLAQMADNQIKFGQQAFALQLLNQALTIIRQLNDTNLAALEQSVSHDIESLTSGIGTNDPTKNYVILNRIDGEINQLPFPSLPLEPVKTMTVNTDHSIWQKILNKSKQALQQIIIVRRIDTDNVLLPPESKQFLYQNVHAQLENMMWALLHQNQTIYQTSLDRTVMLITKYFDQSAPLTKQILSELSSLKDQDMNMQKIELQSTLNLFDQSINAMNGTVKE